jgi:tripartite-type tricarboxylate transporter receptor subunit TctC
MSAQSICRLLLMRFAFTALLALAIGSVGAAAQTAKDEPDWPIRPIRFIESSAPGSAGDVVCRIIAQKLSERLGQQFVMESRPAVGGTLAAEALARAAPDGYTIGMVTTSTHVIAKIFDPSLPFDPIKDFLPISMIGSSPYVLAVYPDLAAKSVADLVILAKSQKQPINNAAYGTTSLGYLASLLFAQRTGIELNQIAYRSSAEAVVDVMQGRVEMQFSTLPPAVPLIQAGKLRALATTGARRVTRLPDVPTLSEQGLSGFDVALWIGVAAPAGTRRAIITRLNREMTEVLRTPDTRKALELQDFVAEPAPPDYLAGRIGGDVKIWRDVVAKANAGAQSH